MAKPKGRPIKFTQKDMETRVLRLANLLYENIIQPENIAQIPVVDQANLYTKCLPYLMTKKGVEDEETTGRNDYSKLINDSFIKRKEKAVEDNQILN